MIKTLNDIQEVLGDRQICVSREITKKFEEHIRGTASEVLEKIGERTLKGEIVIVVGGNKE